MYIEISRGIRPESKSLVGKVLLIGIGIGVLFLAVSFASIQIFSQIFGHDTDSALDGLWYLFAMLGVVFIAGTPILMLVARRNIKKNQWHMDRVNYRYGGILKVLMEIVHFLEQEWLPVYSIKSGQVIVADWFINDVHCPIKISDIVAIYGIKDTGTYIITNDKASIQVMLSDDEWGSTYNVLLSRNPYILYTNDTVTLPSGKVTNVRNAITLNRAYDAVVDEYMRRKL